jgi:hypothetical protein
MDNLSTINAESASSYKYFRSVLFGFEFGCDDVAEVFYRGSCSGCYACDYDEIVVGVVTMMKF